MDDHFGDGAWNEQARHETPTQRLDRNWTELLQEVRVLQTGVQFLTGFLLTLPFQNRFSTLSGAQLDVYLASVSSSALATGFLVAPVSVHRMLFRLHARRSTVDLAATLAKWGLVFLGLSLVGVVTLIFSVVSGKSSGVVAGVLAAAAVLVLWLALPLSVRRRHGWPGSNDTNSASTSETTVPSA